MPSNFRVSMHRNSGNLHLKLIGKFDGTSAHELLNVMKAHARRVSRIFIHTSSPENIDPSGPAVFRAHLELLKGKTMELMFTGENAHILAPEKPTVCELTISTVCQDRSAGSVIRPYHP